MSDDDERDFELTSLLICRQIYECPATGKITYLGLKSYLEFQTVPCILPTLVVAFRSPIAGCPLWVELKTN